MERPTKQKFEIIFLTQSDAANIGIAKAIQKANDLLMNWKIQEM